MGKWSFSDGSITEELRQEIKRISEMSTEEVDAEYAAIGSPDPRVYRLSMYWGRSGDGWCQIDNSTHPDHKSNAVIYWCDYAQAVGFGSPSYTESAYRRACILAHRRSLRKLEV